MTRLRNLVKTLNLLMPVTAIAVVLIIMLHGSVSERVVGIEISLVLLVGWGLVLGSSGKVVHHCLDEVHN